MKVIRISLLLFLSISLLSSSACSKSDPLSSTPASSPDWLQSLPPVDSAEESSTSAPLVTPSDTEPEPAPGSYTEETLFAIEKNESINSLEVHSDGTLDILVQSDLEGGNRAFSWYRAADGKNFEKQDMFWDAEIRERVKPYTVDYQEMRFGEDGSIFLRIFESDKQDELQNMEIYRVLPNKKVEQIEAGKGGKDDWIYHVSNTGKALLYDFSAENAWSRCFDSIKNKQSCKINVSFGGAAVAGDRLVSVSENGKKRFLSLYDLNSGNLLQQHIIKGSSASWGNCKAGLGEDEAYLMDSEKIISINQTTGNCRLLVWKKGFTYNETMSIINLCGDKDGNLYYSVWGNDAGNGLKKLIYDPNGVQEGNV